MSRCNHATCNTPFCPYCGEQTTIETPLLELRNHLMDVVEGHEKRIAQSLAIASRFTEEGDASRAETYRNHAARKAKLRDKWQARVDALNRLVEAAAEAGLTEQENKDE